MIRDLFAPRRVPATSIRCMVLALTFAAGPCPAQAPDSQQGQALFAMCASCHSVDGSQGIGPSLQGLGGRRAGTLPGFTYSRAMKASTLVWNTQSLDAYLADPQGMVPDNLMPHLGVPDAAQRADLVRYLMELPQRRLALMAHAGKLRTSLWATAQTLGGAPAMLGLPKP